MIARQPLAAAPGPGLVLGVLVLLFLGRSLVTFPIEHVDAAFKYLAAANIVRGEGWSELLTNHHTLRWSETVPQVLVTWATGFRYEGLYLLPLLAFAGYGALFWRGLRPALTLSEQIAFLALLFLEPLALKHTGQLLNPPFGVLYSVLAVTVLAVPGRVGWGRVVLATGFYFCAYGAHSTYLAFFAGGFAWLLLFRRQPLHALGLAAGIAALMALETMVFNLLSGAGETAGRLGALADSGHLRNVQNRFPSVPWHRLLTRWGDLPLFSTVLTAGFLACVTWLAVDRRARRAAPPFVLLCLLTGGAYAVAVTFAVVDLDPIRPIMPLLPDYLAPFMPYAAVGTVYGAAALLSGLRRGPRLGLELGAVAVMAGLLAVAAGKKDSWDRLLNYRLNAFMWSSHAEMSALAERYRNGEVMLVGRNRFALDKLVRYDGPARIRRHNQVPLLSSAPRISPSVVCVRQIRQIPLERNGKPCSPAQIEAARSVGVRWHGEPAVEGDDSL